MLEPKCWDDGGDPDDTAAPEAFRKSTLLAQHISFLKDFFRAYKDFSDAHIDTIEIMVSKLYAKWGITERSNFRRMRPEDYPILSDLYDLIEEEFKSYDPNAHLLYTEKLLQEVLLGLHSMCKGADAQFFNGHTNITSSRFLVFGVKGMLSAAKNVRNAMLFNVLSFMSDKLLTVGNAEYHNAVFVGTDVEGVPRHAHKRSANSYGKAFRLNVEGSDPRYSFHHVGTDRSLYVFEAPIDMLSFITLYPENWQRHSYVACCGTSIQPVLQMLEQVPQLDTVLLCLDNDEAGHQASRRMREQLDARYSVERLIPENKDWNDDLTLSGGNAQGFSMNEMR